MPKVRAPHQITSRVRESLYAGHAPLADVHLECIDRDAVPELVALIDERLADLRALRHQLVTHAAGESDTVSCERCGTAFVPRGRGQRFCSNACRQAAFRNGRKA